MSGSKTSCGGRRMSARQLAEQYYNAGLLTFPMAANKRPAFKGWQKPQHFSTYQWPTGRLGIPIPAGVYVLDLDLYKGVTRESIEQKLGCRLDWDAALLQKTANGGEHYAFRHTGEPLMQGSDLLDMQGFDTRRAGAGYICSGEGYTPVRFGPMSMANPAMLPELPAQAAQRLLKPVREATVPTQPLTESQVSDLKSALAHIDPSAGRSDWFSVMTSIRHLTADDPDAGLQIFDDWSRGAYTDEDTPPHNYSGPDHTEQQFLRYKEQQADYIQQ